MIETPKKNKCFFCKLSSLSLKNIIKENKLKKVRISLEAVNQGFIWNGLNQAKPIKMKTKDPKILLKKLLQKK